MLLAASLLAGCGGGGGGGDEPSGGGGGGGSGTPGGGSNPPVNSPQQPTVASIDVIPATAVPVGGQITLTAIARDASGNVVSGAYFTWQSSNASVATVNTSTGIVSAVATGTATLTAQSGQASTTVSITVVPQLEGVVKAGGGHACGITKLGTAYCWGSNEQRQLGLGSASTLVSSNKPLPVVGGMPFIDIAPGGQHTCALSVAGKAYCWGMNTNKQLGDDGASGQLSASPVAVATTQTFKTIDAKGDQTCALTSDGDAYCWPRTLLSGQTIATPSLIGGGLKFASIGVGYRHACGLTAQGAAYCWGTNNTGQLGSASMVWQSDTPVPVTGNLTFAEITAGNEHTCARTAGGQAYCWGSDQYGQLGDGEAYASGATPRLVEGAEQIVSISASGEFTSAVTAQGAALYWGTYQWGCLDGAFGGSCEYYESTKRSASGLGSYDFVKVSAGGLFNVALTSTGKTGAWWLNNFGQLGNGSTANFRTSPLVANVDFQIQVPTSLTVTPGQGTTVQVTINRTGGFTTSGVGLSEPIDLTLQTATGYTGTFQPARIAPEQGQAVLTLNPASSLAAGSSTTLTVRGQAVNGTVRTATMTASVPGGSGSGGDLDLVCTSESTVLPSGYHCMKNSAGQLVPGRYSYPAMHGTWVDEEVGLCINWGSNGLATGRYKAPQLGGGSATTTPSGKWGVIVRRSGTPEGTSTMWYVFTAPLDAQTVLLSYDSASNSIIGWHFQKKACPW
jgi:alpha-tubulin suppressor-like RCC1 family protein